MTRRARRSSAGFTILEMLIATAVMMVVVGGVFALLNPAQGVAQAQPEVADMQQRLRVGLDTLYRDLVMAGAGTYQGAASGSLLNVMAPVMPFRSGDEGSDVAAGIPFREDTISLVYVPSTPAQTTVRADMPRNAAELKVNAVPGCPPDKSDQLCGFKEGMRVLIFDGNGAFDPITITNVQDEALHLQYDGELSTAYKAGSTITQVATHTYYLKSDVATATYQLMHYDGYQTDTPVVDNVVGLTFEYFGDPQPPQLLPNKPLTDTRGPWTTYGSKPPALGVDNASDAWPAGENCAFQVVAGVQVPRLPALGAGSAEVKLDRSLFEDGGPMCPDAASSERFDADLLRIRRIRVTLRVQVGPASMRGSATALVNGRALFVRSGRATSAERFVPDQEIRMDVAPRNLNLGR